MEEGFSGPPGQLATVSPSQRERSDWQARAAMDVAQASRRGGPGPTKDGGEIRKTYL